MTRFAEHCRVIFVEPPDITQDHDQLEMVEQSNQDGVQVLRPMFPARILDTSGNNYEEMWLQLLPSLLADAGPHTMLWVYSPQAEYLVAAAMPEVLFVVYDCMDDLASFRFAATDMREREERLFQQVALVFTGGRSMYEARKDRHPHVYCFPSGVDVEHYRQVYDADLREPDAVATLPHPRLGYFGVLDERIDWRLIDEVAARRPAWHWVLVGPTAKVDPADLPCAANIHYCGKQSYADLPAYLKSFDIATMPFALNEATRFISPTKTLEYLAGGKPVISSSVPDVVATYTGIVDIVDGTDAWIASIEQMLAASAKDHRERRDRAQPLLQAGTWDEIATQMWTLMEAQLNGPATID